MKKTTERGLIFGTLSGLLHFIICIALVTLVAGCSSLKDERAVPVEEAIMLPAPVHVEKEVAKAVLPAVAKKKKAIDHPSRLPKYPWPPEEPSWLVRLDRLYPSISHEQSLYDISEMLSKALQGAKYNHISYYSAPGGFVMVTRLEGIDKNGVSLGNNRRYLLPDDKQDFSFFDYVRNLFFAPEGYYRFIAFVVSDAIYTTEASALSEADALKRLNRGASALPPEYRKMQFSPEHRIDALIYEFHKGGSDNDAKLMQPGRLEPDTHLENSGLSFAFTNVLQL